MVASNPLVKSKSLYIDPASLGGHETINSNNIITLNNNANVRDVTATNICDFYKGTNVFITGGTGFVGKALIEKLLRTCDGIENIYILVRPKRGLGADQRLKELLKNPVFEKIREKNVESLEKIRPLCGDVGQPNLGLNEYDKRLLVEKTDIVFHSAATVR